jgi:hypothetical protein
MKVNPYERSPRKRDDIFSDDGRLKISFPTLNELRLSSKRRKQKIEQLELEVRRLKSEIKKKRRHLFRLSL